MSIIGISVDWMVGWGNPPQLRVHVDYAEDEHRERVAAIPWTPHAHPGRAGCCLWVRDEGGGRWTYMIQTNDPHGFGGRVFKLLQQDGSTVDVKGPWSSNPCAVRDLAGIDLMDVIIVDSHGQHYGGSDYEGTVVQEAITRLAVPIEVTFVEGTFGDGTPWHRWKVTTPKPEVAPEHKGKWAGEFPRYINHWPPALAPVGHIYQTSGIPV